MIYELRGIGDSGGDISTCLGYVEGWRWWISPRPTDYNFVNLNSVFTDHRWTIDGENVATPKPTFDNDSGFHAFKRDHINGLMDGDGAVRGMVVLGRVALYGDVVEHKYGYRAEKARVLDLWCPRTEWATMRDYPYIRFRGSYEITDSLVGGNFRCLTLENRSVLSDTNPSDGPTTSQQMLLLIDRGARLLRWNSPPSWYLSAPETDDARPKVIVPEYVRRYLRPEIHRMEPVCPVCDRWITGDDVVVAEISADILKPDGGGVKKNLSHLSCRIRRDSYGHLWEQTSQTVIGNGPQSGVLMYPSTTMKRWLVPVSGV